MVSIVGESDFIPVHSQGVWAVMVLTRFTESKLKPVGFSGVQHL